MWVVKRTKQLTPPAEWIREGWWEKTQGWKEPEPKGTSSIHPTIFHYTWRPYPSNLLPCESKISNDLLMFPGTSRPPDSSTSLCGSTSIAWHWFSKFPSPSAVQESQHLQKQNPTFKLKFTTSTSKLFIIGVTMPPNFFPQSQVNVPLSVGPTSPKHLKAAWSWSEPRSDADVNPTDLTPSATKV